MANSEKERNRIKAEERTRIAAKIVSSLLGDDLPSESSKASSNKNSKSKKPQNSGSKSCSQSNVAKAKPQVKPKIEKKKQNSGHPNNQRGSKSFTNLSHIQEANFTPAYNRGDPSQNSQIIYGQQTFQNAPPSYDESFRHPTPYVNQPTNQPYTMTDHFNNFPNLSSGISSGAYPGQTVPSTSFVAPNPNIPTNANPYNVPFHQPNQYANQFNNQSHETSRHSINFSDQGAQPKLSKVNPSSAKLLFATTTTVNPKQKKKKKDAKRKIDINIIGRELSECEEFFSSLKTLSQKLNMNSNELSKILKANNHVFSTLNDPIKGDTLVELCPKVELCKHHQQKGCSRVDCAKIHLCEDFMLSNCIRKDCPLGHSNSLKSDHNVKILKKLYISTLPNKTIQQLVQRACTKFPSLLICHDYNQGNCQSAEKCKSLHICNSYANGLGFCSNENCTRNHNILDAKIIIVLKSLGISTSESPRDILKILRDKRILKENENEATKKLIKSTSTSDDNKETSVKKTKTKNKKATKSDNPINCTNFLGSVKIPKICLDNIKSTCKVIENDCPYLHCCHKSHWQFGKDDKWYNFDEHHSKLIDSSYSDPNCEAINLPNLDISNLNSSQLNLLTLLGKKNLEINFRKMTFYCESPDKTYSIRNLTTESSVLSNDDDADTYTKFKWYVIDNDEKWKLFCDSDYGSAAVEEAYIKNPKKILKFQTDKDSYTIDFFKLTQRNETTHIIRPLRRRPYVSHSDKSSDMNIKENEQKVDLPKTWEEMKSEKTKLVKLNCNDEEYSDVRQRLSRTLPMMNIINIWRVQNILLWQKFKNSQNELEKQYNDKFLNVQKLFNGIDSKFVNDLIGENLQFKHQSLNAIRSKSFYNSASNAASTCKADPTGKKTLLIAEVIIGKVVKGSESNNTSYNTTVDNVQNPTVFVKYNFDEYYPAYIVDFN